MTAGVESSATIAVADLRVSVVVVDRSSERLDDCLRALAQQTIAPHEVIVAITGSKTTGLTDHPGVRVVRTPHGASIASARRAAGEVATGEIVAFLDDDIVVDTVWLDRMRTPYADPRVAGVGGRVAQGLDGETHSGLADVGRLLPDGRLTNNFAADPGRPIEVDHLPPANLSFRRCLYRAIGGFDGVFPDEGRHAEASASIRIRRAGGILLFIPDAVGCGPTPAPPTSRLQDPAELYRWRRSHAALLVCLFGRRAAIVRHYTRVTSREQYERLVEAAMLTTPYWGRADGTRRPLRRRLQAHFPLGYAAAELAGLAVGIGTGRPAQRVVWQNQPEWV